MTSHYDVLCLDCSADDADIRAAFRKRALESHPDKGGNAIEFRSVMAAFETLGDKKRRLCYDTDIMRLKPQVEENRVQSSQPGDSTRKRILQCDVQDKLEQFYCQVEGLLLFLKPESRRQGIASLSREQRSVLMERALRRKAAAFMPSEDCDDDPLPEDHPSFSPRRVSSERVRHTTEEAICQFKANDAGEFKNRVRDSWEQDGYFVLIRMGMGVHCKTQSLPSLASAVDLHCLLSSIRSNCVVNNAHTYESLELTILAALQDANCTVRMHWRAALHVWGRELKGPFCTKLRTALEARRKLQEAYGPRIRSFGLGIPCAVEHLDAQLQRVTETYLNIWKEFDTGHETRPNNLPHQVLDSFQKFRAQHCIAISEYHARRSQDESRQDALLLAKLNKLISCEARRLVKAARQSKAQKQIVGTSQPHSLDEILDCQRHAAKHRRRGGT